ncbi:MAG: tetratricopeptide repeat protein [Phycisphaerales bacterium]|nr:MAG: tetratricopeptide repeat protein [Phycisphaerales bacterium]UCF35006.1 MAG: tetratricopeptide repeat protein [Phycisphaerales bacterium]
MSDLMPGLGDEPLLTLDDEQRQLLSVLGDRLLAENKFEEARSVYEVLLASDRKNPFYNRAFGICCEQTNRMEEAKEALDRAINLDPQDAYAFTGRAAIRLREGDKEGALQDLQAAQATPVGQKDPLAKRIAALMGSAQ